MFSTAFLDLPALQGASGTVTLPGSKSISNRVLLLSALCQGTTVVHDLLDSDDTRVMLAALRQLGCGVDVQGTTVTITGLGGQLKHHDAIEFFMGNAGTAMRPLTAALAVLGGDFTLKGVPRMHERPIGDLVDALRLLGCSIDYLGNDGFPPLHIGKPSLKVDAPIQVRGDVSSQFLTALLMALPLAAKTQDIVIEVVGELISKPYIDITLNLLARYGIAVQRDGWQRFTIPQGCSYQSPGTIHVEADASSASYFIALGAIANGDGIRIQGVGADSIQGDIRFMDAAAQMGAKITSGPNWLEIHRGAWPLKGITLDCNHIPDAAMTLAVMALYADGPTTQTGSRFTHSNPNNVKPQASTPTTTIASPCVSRSQPSMPMKCPFASKTPSAWPKLSPITSRLCSLWRTQIPNTSPSFASMAPPPRAKALWPVVWRRLWAITTLTQALSTA